MNAVATELNQSTTDITLRSQLFASCGVITSADAGNFHNFNNMTTANNSSFSLAINQPFNNGTFGADLLLGNWAYYDHDIDWVVDFELINNGKDTVTVELWFGQSNGSFTDLFYTTTLNANTTDTQNSFTTGIPSYATGFTSYGGEYYILMNAIPNNPVDPQFMDVVSAGDTDGTGSGTTRTNYTAVNGQWDFSTQGNFSTYIVAGNSQNDGISWSKRTTFQIVFT